MWKARARHGNLDGDRGPACEFTDRPKKPALSQHRGMHPARDLAQLGTCCVNPCADVSQRLATVREQLRHASETPLCTLAQLALQATPLFVRRLDDPAPRRLHLGNACSHLSLKMSVRNREPGR